MIPPGTSVMISDPEVCLSSSCVINQFRNTLGIQINPQLYRVTAMRLSVSDEHTI